MYTFEYPLNPPLSEFRHHASRWKVPIFTNRANNQPVLTLDQLFLMSLEARRYKNWYMWAKRVRRQKLLWPTQVILPPRKTNFDHFELNFPPDPPPAPPPSRTRQRRPFSPDPLPANWRKSGIIGGVKRYIFFRYVARAYKELHKLTPQKRNGRYSAQLWISGLPYKTKSPHVYTHGRFLPNPFEDSKELPVLDTLLKMKYTRWRVFERGMVNGVSIIVALIKFTIKVRCGVDASHHFLSRREFEALRTGFFNYSEIALPPPPPKLSEREKALPLQEAPQLRKHDFFAPYTEKIEKLGNKPKPPMVTEAHRLPEYKYDLAKFLYDQGVHFFMPVFAGSKIQAWRRPRNKPMRLESIRAVVNDKHGKNKNYAYKYDLAVMTGNWKMPDRNQDQVLVVLDVDSWIELKIGHAPIEAILRQNETFVIQTQRGLHFYYWVPAWAAKSRSLTEVLDLQGRRRITVLTGFDRTVFHYAPIAQLPIAKINEITDYFRRYEAFRRYKRWSLSAVKNLGFKGDKVVRHPPDYVALEGSRNQFVNGELYRLRFQLSDQELLDYAQDLAENRCDPPYPPKEAEAVARSIIRTRRLDHPRQVPIVTGLQIQKGQHPAHRLAKYYPKTGVRFTRKDYENALRADHWNDNLRERIPITQTDLTYNLEHGYIKIVDKISGPKGGRPTLVYERIQDTDLDMSFVLPVKATAKALRLSLFMWLVPDEPMEMVRSTTAKYLGVKKETVTAYARTLQDYKEWGGALLRRKIQTPLITSPLLNPRAKVTKEWPLPNKQYRELHREHVHYRATVYQRHPFYHAIMRKGLPPKSPEEQAKEKANTRHQDEANRLIREIQGLGPNDPIPRLPPRPIPPPETDEGPIIYIGQALNDLVEMMAANYEREHGVNPLIKARQQIAAKEAAAERAERRRRRHEKYKAPVEEYRVMEIISNANNLLTCPNCENLFEFERGRKLCRKCTAKKQEIERKRNEMDYVKGAPTLDCCVFCSKFFESTDYPLTGLCDVCLKTHIFDKEPIIPYYCSNVKCDHIFYATHYNSWILPKECPVCKAGSYGYPIWRTTPYPPEETVPMYPINYYLENGGGMTLFDFMSQYPLDNPRVYENFQAKYTPKQIKAWREYTGGDYIETECPACKGPYRVHKTKIEKNGLAHCPTCEAILLQQVSIPPEVQHLVTLEEAAEVVRVAAVFESVLGRKPKKPDDISSLVKKYSGDWVDCAIRTAKRYIDHRPKGEKPIYHYLPYVRGVLENWARQGYINFEARHLGKAALEEYWQTHRDWTPDQLQEIGQAAPSAYHLFARLTKQLNSFTVPLIVHAVQKYGDEAVRTIIIKMVAENYTSWNYARVILTHLEAASQAATTT